MKHFLLTMFVVITFNNSNAQITITMSQMPSSGDTGRYSIANLNSISNYTTTGANYNWDFSSLVPNDQWMRKFQPSLSTPYGFYFLPPKYGEKTLDSVPIPNIPLGGISISIKNIFSFYRKNSTTSFNSEGLGLTLSGIPIGATFSDEDELYKFPLDYLDRDSTTFKLSTPSNSLIPFTYKKQGYRITEADGWGTVTTPYGTEPCLRVVTTQYSIDTIAISALPAGFNKFGFPNYMRSYQWLTLNEKIPYLEVLGNVVLGNFTATQVRYRDMIRYFVGVKEQEQQIALSVFPNPSTTDLFTVLLPKTNESVLYSLSDLQGKLILSGKLNNNNELVNKHDIETKSIAKGLYVLTLTNQLIKQDIKISVQ